MQRQRLAKEIVPVEIEGAKTRAKFCEDEFPRPETTLAALASLAPVFKKEGGSVTAGNSSGINDGACALLLASGIALKKYGLEPKARILTSAVAGVEPRIMGLGPVPATRKVLSRAGLTLSQIDIIEINEAFAAQCLVCLRELGLDFQDPRLNPNGGAIALGHPLGMSGARLVATATYELSERKLRYALCTMCVGVGQGAAVIIERVS
jgi:acetyl-CoA acetyltransferase family protein